MHTARRIECTCRVSSAQIQRLPWQCSSVVHACWHIEVGQRNRRQYGSGSMDLARWGYLWLSAWDLSTSLVWHVCLVQTMLPARRSVVVTNVLCVRRRAPGEGLGATDTTADICVRLLLLLLKLLLLLHLLCEVEKNIQERELRQMFEGGGLLNVKKSGVLHVTYSARRGGEQSDVVKNLISDIECSDNRHDARPGSGLGS